MSEMVTVRTDNGEEAEVSAEHAEAHGLEVIHRPDKAPPSEKALEHARYLDAHGHELVRVKLPDGGEATVSRAAAEVFKFKVLKDKRAVDGFGNPLADKPHIDLSSLKGNALDDALEKAGLSKSGTADEKRARLAEHQASQADANSNQGEVSS